MGLLNVNFCGLAGDNDSCVQHLTNAIAVCGQPQQLLQVFQQTLPPEVFRMLINNITSLPTSGKGSVKMMDQVCEKSEFNWFSAL